MFPFGEERALEGLRVPLKKVRMLLKRDVCTFERGMPLGRCECLSFWRGREYLKEIC